MPHSHQNALGPFGPLLFMAIIGLAAFLYLRGWRALRTTQDSVSILRASSFIGGLFFVWVSIASRIASLDHELLTVHMLKHLLLMTVAPPLIWLGNPFRALVQVVPESAVRMFHRASLRRLGRLVGSPQFGWLAATAALVLWHIPGIFALGLRSPAWHFFEQASFFLSGLLFWWPVIQPWPSTSIPDLSMILYLFFATLPCDILSGFLVFCDRVVYPVYLSSSHLPGFSALDDQQCAAALMWTGVTVVYLVAGTVLTMRLLSPQRATGGPLASPGMRGTVSRLEAFQHGD